MNTKNFSLPKSRIVRTHDDFQKIYSSGKSFANRFLVLYVLPSESLKVGFAAGKKLGNAVIRSRVKRILREAFRLNQHRLKNNVQILLVGRKALIDQKMQVAEKSFIDLCKRADILS